MKRMYRIAIALFLTMSIGLTFGFYERKPDKDRVLLELIQYVLEAGHYDPSELDTDFSLRFYKDYIEALDYSKRYFLKSDIESFEQFNTMLDDQIKMGDLTFFDLTYQRVSKRIADIEPIYTEILSEPFDFNKKDVLITDKKKLDYVETKEELKDRWRLYLKYNTLVRLTEELESQKKRVEEGDAENVKTFEELEAEARAETLKTFNDLNTRWKELERDDWFSIYLNVMTSQFDPHTNYFAPQEKKMFDQGMSGKLEGIGARLQSKDGYVTVIEVISGSPSWKQGELEVEDKILKVAQGSEGEPVNIVGMRLDDSVDLIKGKKGTIVKLWLKKIDGSKKTIEITRDIVEIDETFAKSSIIEKNGKKYGLINLPKFYVDFDDRNARNAGDDVEKEVKYLKSENVEGIILDLRNNGGGSLQTAIKMSGLFIDQGPIVQVKSRDKAPQVLEDTESGILWNGPLVIIINEYSASASEIVAAALKDYNRAVIIGSKHSYGKGTVQNIWDLDKLINPNLDVDPLGSIKLTIQKFYRINGGATQLKGVESDVVIPDRYSYLEIGEKEQENPMEWDTIQPLKYEIWDGDLNLEKVKKNSSERIADSEIFKLIDENAVWLKKRRDESNVALDLESFEKENKAFEKEVEKFKPISKYDNKLAFTSTKHEMEVLVQDSLLTKKRERWHKALKKDVYVEEAVNILGDL